MNDEEEYDPEALIELLKDGDRLQSFGFDLTPKGAIALTLISDQGLSYEEAEALSTKIDNAIFLAGWIYLKEDQIQIVEDD